MPRVCLAKPNQADPLGEECMDNLAGRDNELFGLPPRDVSCKWSRLEVEVSLAWMEGPIVAMAVWQLGSRNNRLS